MLTINLGDSVIEGLTKPTVTVANINQQLLDEDGNPVITAAPIPDESSSNDDIAKGEAFYIKIIPEGILTDDKRYFEHGSLEVRELPVPLLYQLETSEQHMKSVPVGTITNVWRVGNFVVGTGNFFDPDTNTHVQEAIDAIGQGYERVSADIVAAERYIEWGVDKDGFEVVNRVIFTSGKVAGATIVAVSAFDEARIQLGEAPDPVSALVASGAFPDGFQEAFLMPEHDAPMPLTLRELDNGIVQVYGYVAAWGTCYVGAAECVQPPNSKTNYSHFQLGLHDDVRVGALTMDTGHAKIRHNMENTRSHYDNTGSIAAYIQCVENNFGIAFTGYLDPSLSDEQVRRLSACGVSGDWRWDKNANNLELTAVLAVPTGGFSTPRAFEAEPGHQLSLVASGAICRPCQQGESLDDVLAKYFNGKSDEDVTAELQDTLDALLDKVV